MRRNEKAYLVLIVDDEELIREMYSDYLQQHGYKVKTASNGEEALTEIRLYPPDIILADVVLKDMSGFDLYRQVRLFNRETPFIFMTGYSHDQHILEELEHLNLPWFSKPVQLSDILSLIENTLGLSS